MNTIQTRGKTHWFAHSKLSCVAAAALGPVILVGHSWAGVVITEAGMETNSPDEERFFAKRMNATTTELNTSHVHMLSKPKEVAAADMDAAAKAATNKSSPKGAFTATQNLTAIRRGIEETIHRFEDAFNRGDAAGAARQFYTRDARVLPPGAETVRGRDRIAEFWATAAAAPQMGLRRLELSTLELQALGDEAYEIGRATLTLAGGKRTTPKYVAVWKYEDGAWRRHVDIWNMDTPFTAPEAAHASAQFLFPANFQTKEIQTDGATIHVRVGGQGPAVVLLHGFGDTGDMWAPMAAELARDHRVVVPDLRGMGLSSHPAGGYDKKTQAADIRSVLAQLGIDRAVVVGHDIGATVAYAYAARYPDKTDRLVVMDAPVPGIPPWDEIVRSPTLWHFSFGGPDAERLVAGRERIYLDRFWNEFAGDPSKIDEATRVHYAAFYAQPGAMHSAFAQFLSIPKDAEDNKVSMTTKLTMPVLAIGAAKMFGAKEAIVMRNAASNVTEVVIANSGHWLMEEQPIATIVAVHNFLDRKITTTMSSPEKPSANQL